MDDDYYSSIKRLSKMKITIAIALFVAAVAIFVGGKAFALVSRHTVESRIAVILKKKPHLKEAAKISGGKLRILIFKNDGIEYLNPNSRFYLSLKVSYPNVSDRARAKVDKRVNLGGDIMIHGKAVTI